MENTISKTVISSGIEDINKLFKLEYKIDLVELLKGEDTELVLERLRRLTGILLKRPFASPESIEPAKTETGSFRSWSWDDKLMQSSEDCKSSEYQLLIEMAKQYDEKASGISAFSDLRERGLYKCLALWLKNKASGEDTNSIQEYLSKHESPEFESLLDIFNNLSQASITAVLMAYTCVPGIAVVLALMGTRYGYRKLIEDKNISDQ